MQPGPGLTHTHVRAQTDQELPDRNCHRHDEKSSLGRRLWVAPSTSGPIVGDQTRFLVSALNTTLDPNTHLLYLSPLPFLSASDRSRITDETVGAGFGRKFLGVRVSRRLADGLHDVGRPGETRARRSRRDKPDPVAKTLRDHRPQHNTPPRRQTVLGLVGVVIVRVQRPRV